MINENKATFTVKELSEELNTSLVTAYNLCKEKGFPTVRVGGRVLISTEGFKKWLKEKQEAK